MTGNRFPNEELREYRAAFMQSVGALRRNDGACGFIAKFNSINFKGKKKGTPSVGAMLAKTCCFANDMHGFALFRNGEFARFQLSHDATSVQERLCV